MVLFCSAESVNERGVGESIGTRASRTVIAEFAEFSLSCVQSMPSSAISFKGSGRRRRVEICGAAISEVLLSVTTTFGTASAGISERRKAFRATLARLGLQASVLSATGATAACCFRALSDVRGDVKPDEERRGELAERGAAGLQAFSMGLRGEVPPRPSKRGLKSAAESAAVGLLALACLELEAGEEPPRRPPAKLPPIIFTEVFG